MLEAYDQQCDEAAKIFAEYHKRLHQYVNQARDAQRFSIDSSLEEVSSFSANSSKEAVYSTVKGTKSADDVILIETTWERNIRKACESLAVYMVERIRNSFPAYEGSGIHLNPQSEAAKLGMDFDGDIPDDVRTVIVNCLKNPPHLLRAITAYTLRLKTLVSREIEKIDVRADAELLRYANIFFPFHVGSCKCNFCSLFPQIVGVSIYPAHSKISCYLYCNNCLVAVIHLIILYVLNVL
jgi:hypothetical protein